MNNLCYKENVMIIMSIIDKNKITRGSYFRVSIKCLLSEIWYMEFCGDGRRLIWQE